MDGQTRAVGLLIGVMTLLDGHEPIAFGLPVLLIAGSNGQNFGDPPLNREQ